jgi:hypothetical protein
MKNVSGMSFREKQSTHFMFKKCSIENREFFKIMWKNVVQLDKLYHIIVYIYIYIVYYNI